MDTADIEMGLALGGGGARGAAHVPFLELLDELGIRPARIAGSSIGAVLGALYAYGLSGKDIRELLVRNQTPRGLDWRGILEKKNDLVKWMNALIPEFKRGGLLKSDRFLDMLFEDIGPMRFEDLRMPLLVVATDFWSGREVVFDSGDVLAAIRASIAIPGVFAPVPWGDTLLMDGGVANQLPYDHLLQDCQPVVAVDVSPRQNRFENRHPHHFDLLAGAYEIARERLLEERLKHRPPDVYLRPDLPGIGLFDFDKVEDVLERAQPKVQEARRALLEIIRHPRRACASS